MEIRGYTKNDWKRLCEIHDDARKQELALAGLEEAFLPLEVAAIQERLFDYSVYVAQANEVLGFIAFTAHEIAWLYVDPKHSGKGIGGALIAFALSHMEKEVELEVLVGNTKAKRLYEKMGFIVCEENHGNMPGNEQFEVNVYCMRRK